MLKHILHQYFHKTVFSEGCLTKLQKIVSIRPAVFLPEQFENAPNLVKI